MHPKLILALLVLVLAAAGAAIGIAVVTAWFNVYLLDLGATWDLWRLACLVVAAAIGGYLAVLLAFSLMLTLLVRKVGSREFGELAASMPRTGRSPGFLSVPFRRVLLLYTSRAE